MSAIVALGVALIFSGQVSFAKPPPKPRAKPAQNLTAKELFARSKDAVVTIRTDKGSGTGFLTYNSRIVITCHHVIAGATSLQVTDARGRPISILKIATDKASDAAVLVVTAPPGSASLEVVNTNNVNPGEPVVVIGNPLGVLTQTLTTGVVSAKRQVGDIKLVQIDAATSPGSSGSPIILSNGAVVGFVSFSFSRGQALNMGVACFEVAKAAKRGWRTLDQFVADNRAVKSATEPEVAVDKSTAATESAGPFRKAAASDKDIAATRHYTRLLNEMYSSVISLFISCTQWSKGQISADSFLDQALRTRDLVLHLTDEEYLGEVSVDYQPESLKKVLNDVRALTLTYTDEVQKMISAIKQEEADEFRKHAFAASAQSGPLGAEADRIVKVLLNQAWMQADLLLEGVSPPVFFLLHGTVVNRVIPDPNFGRSAVVGFSIEEDKSILQSGDVITDIKAADGEEWHSVANWKDILYFIARNRLDDAMVKVQRNGKSVTGSAVFYRAKK